MRSLLEAESESRTFQVAEPPAAEGYPRFGGFQAESILGSGGGGIVYCAIRTDGLFEQRVAIKVLRPSTGPLGPVGFIEESQILARLRHPGIAQIFDAGITADGLSYIVMEYIEGLPLDEFCRVHRLDFNARLELLRQISEAIVYAHRNLVVHLDLKPSNILVNPDRRPKLLDFGTAKILASYDGGATQSMATPRYASPEQLRGEHAGILSDVFSLGVLCSELLTGHWPFGNPESRVVALQRSIEEMDIKALEEVSENHAQSCRSSQSKLRQRIEGDLSAILRKAISFRPESRYPTVEDFLRDVDGYLQSRPVQARRAPAIYKIRRFVRRHRLLAANAALVLVVLAAFAGFQIRTVRQQTAIRKTIQDELIGDISRLLANTDRTAEARASLSEVAERLEQYKMSWAGEEWYLWAGTLRRDLGELNFDRYRKSLNDPRAAVLDFEQSIRDFEQNPRQLPNDQFATYQSYADALLEAGRANEAYQILVRRLTPLETQLDPRQEINRAAFWDRLADWLGAWEVSCGTAEANASKSRACQVPLFYSFALDKAAAHYDVAFRATPTALIGRHYADVLIRLNRSGEAQKVLAKMPEDSAALQGLLGKIDFERARYNSAVQHYAAALRLSPSRGADLFQLRTRGRLQFELGRTQARLGVREAALNTSQALELLWELTRGREATSDVFELAACFYLTAEPAGLRNTARAELLTRRAVEITGGQVAPLLVTLAHASGRYEDLVRAARLVWHQGNILKPIVPPAFQQEFEASQRQARTLAGILQ